MHDSSCGNTRFQKDFINLSEKNFQGKNLWLVLRSLEYKLHMWKWES